MDEMSTLLNEIGRMLGISVTPANQAKVKAEYIVLANWLINKYPTTPLGEIKLAYELAIMGETELDDIIPSLTPLQFGRIWKAYRTYKTKSVEFRQALEHKHADSYKPKELSEVDIFQIMYDTFTIAYQTAKEGNTYQDIGNGLYDWLDAKQLIPFTPEQKQTMWQEAITESAKKAQVQASATNLNRSQKKPFKDLIAAIMHGGNTPDSVTYIRIQAKNIALNRLLTDLIEMEIEPNEFLSEPE